MPTLDFGELSLDTDTLNTNFMSRAHNCVPLLRGYGGLRSLSAVSPAMDAAALGGVSMIKNDTTPYNYAGNATKLYEISETAATDRSKGGGYSLSGTEGWEFTKFGENVIAVSYGENPQTMTIGGTVFADLGGTPPKASAIATVRDFVVLGDIDDGTQYPARIHWSASNDSTGWTAGTGLSDTQDLFGGGGRIMRIIGGEFGTIFQERAIWRMTFEGLPTVFRLDEIETGRGTTAKWSVVRVGGLFYYLANEGFMVFDGNQSQPIGEARVDEYFKERVYTDNIHLMHGAADPQNSRIIWVYPTDEGTPNEALIYDYVQNKWTTADITSEFLMPALSGGFTLEQLDNISSDLDALPAGLDSSSYIGGEYSLGAFNSDHKLAMFSGAVRAATLETPTLQLNPLGTSLIQSVNDRSDGTATVQIGTRNKRKDAFSWSPVTSVDSTGEAHFLSDARYHKIRLNLTGWKEVNGLDFDATATGSR